MKKYTQGIIIIIICFIASCASVTQDIKVDSEMDPKANLDGYKTYAWLGSAAILFDPEGKWEPPEFDADAEIKFLIDRELRKRGMTEVTAAPDMIVGFAAGINMEALKLIENPDTKMLMVRNKPKGALAVVFIDASTGYPIWVGQASADIQKDPDNETVKKRLDYAVSEMFKLLRK